MSVYLWGMCAVPIMAVFCSSLISCFSGMLLRYCLNDFEMISVAPVIAGVTYVFTFHMRCISVVKVFISIPRVRSVKTQLIYCQLTLRLLKSHTHTYIYIYIYIYI